MGVDQRVLDVLSEFARTVVTDFPIRAILDDLVLRVVELLPIDSAGVTIISLGHGPREMAASNAMALRLEGLQTKLGAGPCVAAFDSNAAILIPDMRADKRFPSFTEHSDSHGLAAVFTFPLRDGARGIGALDLYRTTPGPLGIDDQATAQTFCRRCVGLSAQCPIPAGADSGRRERAHESGKAP